MNKVNSMKFKLFLVLFLITVGILAYLAYPVVRERYFNAKPKVIKIQNESAVQESDSADINTQINNNAAGEIKSSSIGITILPLDCDSECSKFEKKDELEYCKEVCGLANVDQENAENKKTDNCENTNGLQKDYCLKDLATQKNDFKICDQISDSGIKKACKNRITEDILEKQL